MFLSVTLLVCIFLSLSSRCEEEEESELATGWSAATVSGGAGEETSGGD